MCLKPPKPKTPALPARPVAPPPAVQGASEVGTPTAVLERKRLDPNTLRQYSLRFPPNFFIPS